MRNVQQCFYVQQCGDLSRYGCVLGPFVIDGLFLPPFVIVGCGRGFDVFLETIWGPIALRLCFGSFCDRWLWAWCLTFFFKQFEDLLGYGFVLRPASCNLSLLLWTERHSTQCKVYSIQYTSHSIQYIVHSIKYTVRSTLYTIHHVQYTVHSIHTRYTVYSALHTVYSIQHTVYSAV